MLYTKNPRDAFDKLSSLCDWDKAKNPLFCLNLDISDMKDFTVETGLWPKEALEFYSKMNLCQSTTNEDYLKYNVDYRGGGQGDYSFNMKYKIANVIDCLSKFSDSKRAFIDIPNEPVVDHKMTDKIKCLREIHFYRTCIKGGNQLNTNVFVRAQAVDIFPKNIHFIGSLMELVAESLNWDVGACQYHATHLVGNRD